MGIVTAVRGSGSIARKPFLSFPGAFYHSLNRDKQRHPILHDESDYQALMAALAVASVRYQLRIHAFCLISPAGGIRRSQNQLMAEPDQLERIGGLLQAG